MQQQQIAHTQRKAFSAEQQKGFEWETEEVIPFPYINILGLLPEICKAMMDEKTIEKPNGIITNGFIECGSDDGSADNEECDVEVWNMLSRSFRQAQTVLDQNHALIQQVNENHQPKRPDNLVKNVALIREINATSGHFGIEE